MRPSVLPSRFNWLVRRLGCGRVLRRSWNTGWVEVARALNSGITFMRVAGHHGARAAYSRK